MSNDSIIKTVSNSDVTRDQLLLSYTQAEEAFQSLADAQLVFLNSQRTKEDF